MSIFRNRSIRPGAPPGIATVEAPPGAAVEGSIDIVDFDRETLVERAGASLDDARQYADSPRTTWLHVQGAVDRSLLAALGGAYSLHPLALEDVMNAGQRAKLDPYEDQLFIVLQVPEIGADGIRLRQLSLFLGAHWVVTFYEGPNDPFDPIRERLRNRASPRIRRSGNDYLAYALLDFAVDLAFPALDSYATRIETLERVVFDDPSREALDDIHQLKREMLVLRRALWPQREVLSTLTRDELPLISDETRLFLRDCYDHTIQVMDLLESFREMGSSLLDVYLSSVSNRMNDVMKVLTIISTTFIPLSFLVGVYGMNFDTAASAWNMPELGWRYAYPALLVLMVSIVGAMLLFFRRRRWL